MDSCGSDLSVWWHRDPRGWHFPQESDELGACRIALDVRMPLCAHGIYLAESKPRGSFVDRRKRSLVRGVFATPTAACSLAEHFTNVSAIKFYIQAKVMSSG